MALTEDVRRANQEIAARDAAAAPRLDEDAVMRLRALLKPRVVEAVPQEALRSARSARSARVGDS